MKRWEFIIIMTLLTITTLGTLVALVLSIWPYDILDIPPTAGLVSTTLKRGENLQYIGYMNKKMAIPSTQDCYFVNGVKYSLPPRTTNREPGYYDEIVEIAVPVEIPAGEEITYSCDIIYKPNPFRTVTYHWTTIPFTIIE